MNPYESSSYRHLAQEMADQFRNGENVHAENLEFLKNFSDASNASYDWLMDEIADMYGVTPRDVVHESRVAEQTATRLGSFVFAGLERP